MNIWTCSSLARLEDNDALSRDEAEKAEDTRAK